MSEFLFVYGTLLPDVASESIAPVLSRVRRLGAATVRGTLFDLGNFPGLSLDADGVVRGELVQVRSASLWLRLDAYEGCSPAHPKRSLFRRERCVATRILDSSDAGAGEQLEAWVYVYNRDLGDAPRIDSGCWLTHLFDQEPDVVAVPIG